jgi:hypothetical protein
VLQLTVILVRFLYSRLEVDTPIKIIIIIIINIKYWTLWSVPSPELQLLSPSFLRSPNCSPSIVVCSGMILKGFGFVTFLVGVKASSVCIHLSCLVCVVCSSRGTESFVLWSLKVWPARGLNDFISAASILRLCEAVGVQFSNPYKNVGKN